MTDHPEYVLDRVFDAPRHMVWRTWTDPKLLARWYGPNVETIIHSFDLRAGGQWRNEMRMGDKSMFSVADFTKVEPEERLEWLHANTDADWNIAASPMMPDWPRLLMTVVTFKEAGDKTHLRLTWTPHEATEAEIACFAGAVSGMGKGWESGFGIIDEMLAEMKAQG